MAIPDSVAILDADLHEIFGARLRSLVAYGVRASAAPHAGVHAHGDGHHLERALAHTLAIAETLTAEDLRACAGRVKKWDAAGLATPLLLAAHEFERSLDAFPLEFGAMIADHVVVSGRNPFEGLRVEAADVRRACELQARSHLLHLREGLLETRGRADALSVLILQSAPAFAALVSSIARLENRGSDDVTAAARHAERILGLPGGPVTDVTNLVGAHDLTSAAAERLIAPYFDAVERLVQYVDGWASK
jgi:hypothetical protein